MENSRSRSHILTSPVRCGKMCIQNLGKEILNRNREGKKKMSKNYEMTEDQELWYRSTIRWVFKEYPDESVNRQYDILGIWRTI